MSKEEWHGMKQQLDTMVHQHEALMALLTERLGSGGDSGGKAASSN